MKKKIIVGLMALMLAVAMVFTAVACGPKKPNKPSKPDVKPDPVVETTDATGSNVVPVIFTGLNRAFNGIITTTTALSAKGTLYVQIGETKISIAIAGCFDANVMGNNKGSIVVSADTKGESKDFVKIYVENDVVYFGDGLTQNEIKWVRLDQIKSMAFISANFSKLPTLLKDLASKKTPVDIGGLGLLDGILGEDFIQQLVGDLAPIIGVLFPEKGVAPEGFFIPNDESTKAPVIAGDYEIKLDLSAISGFLKAVPSLGSVLTGAIGKLDAGLKGIINTVCTTILGGTLDEFVAGTIDQAKAPTIKLSASITANNDITDLGISYSKKGAKGEADTKVAFGISDFAISDNAAENITPAGLNINKVGAEENAAIEVKAELDLPIKKIKVVATGYIVPEISLVPKVAVVGGKDVTFVGMNFDGLTGTAFGTIYGKDGTKIDAPIAIEFKKIASGEFQLRFDLAALFAAVGIVDPTIKTQYYSNFDIQKAYDDFIANKIKLSGGVLKVAQANEVAPADGTYVPTTNLDKLIDGVVKEFQLPGAVNIMKLITGNIGNALNVLKELLATVQGGIVVTDGTETVPGKVDVDIAKIFQDLIAPTGMIGSSTYPIPWTNVADGTSGTNTLSHYVNVSFITVIEQAFKMIPNTLGGYIMDIVGIARPTGAADLADLNTYLGNYLLNATNGAKLTIATLGKDAFGILATVKCNEIVYASAKASVKIVTAADAKAAIATNQKSWTKWDAANAVDLGVKATSDTGVVTKPNLIAFGATMKLFLPHFSTTKN